MFGLLICLLFGEFSYCLLCTDVGLLRCVLFVAVLFGAGRFYCFEIGGVCLIVLLVFFFILILLFGGIVVICFLGLVGCGCGLY